MARDQAQIETEIANLETVLSAAASSVTRDNHTTSFDLEEARKRLASLRKELADVTDDPSSVKRPVLSRIMLN